jgi:predicted nucleotidyltransferase
MNSGLSAEEIAEIVDCLKQYPAIKQAILFGSRAKGNFQPGSDVDIAIVGGKYEDAPALSVTLNEETRLPYKFDVITYETITSPELRGHIDRIGFPLLPELPL